MATKYVRSLFLTCRKGLDDVSLWLLPDPSLRHLGRLMTTIVCLPFTGKNFVHSACLLARNVKCRQHYSFRVSSLIMWRKCSPGKKLKLLL